MLSGPPKVLRISHPPGIIIVDSPVPTRAFRGNLLRFESLIYVESGRMVAGISDSRTDMHLDGCFRRQIPSFLVRSPVCDGLTQLAVSDYNNRSRRHPRPLVDQPVGKSSEALVSQLFLVYLFV